MLNDLLAKNQSSDKLYVEDVFSTWLYTGTGASQTITNGVDLAGKGGLVWTKFRSGSFGTEQHALIDTARGANYYLSSDSTAAQVTSYSNVLTAFNSNGYTLGADTSSGKVNYSAQNYASWTFRKAPKFFDVVTVASVPTAPTLTTVNHSLGVTPGMIIYKRTSGTSEWMVWHRSTGNNNLALNTTGAAGSSYAGYVMNVTASSFQVYAADYAGAYVFYVFAHDTTADGVIQCGSYTGTSASNPINLGWEPQFLLIKRTDGVASWYIQDVMRDMSQTNTRTLSPNTSGSEYNNAGPIVFPTATGFDFASGGYSGWNQSGFSYIYLAIRRGPMRVPTDATKVFTPVARAGTSAVATVTAGFAPDTAIISPRNNVGSSYDWGFHFMDKLRGGPGYRLGAAFSDAENTAVSVISQYTNTGIDLPSVGYNSTNGSGYDYINYLLRRAPGFFDVVCYTGTNYVNPVKSHNLGVTPEFILVKRRDTSTNWFALHTPAGLRYSFYLNNQGPIDFGAGSNIWAPTSTTFTASAALGLDASGATYVAYLFASCPGVSKVGTYTGTGSSTQNVDCGFTNGARFVFIKANAVAGTTADGGWAVFDTARGINVGNDPILWLNYTYAEYNTYNHISPYSAGFKVEADNGNSGLNASGVQYIYLAIA